jgi:hypothetical protein
MIEELSTPSPYYPCSAQAVQHAVEQLGERIARLNQSIHETVAAPAVNRDQLKTLNEELKSAFQTYLSLSQAM